MRDFCLTIFRCDGKLNLKLLLNISCTKNAINYIYIKVIIIRQKNIIITEGKMLADNFWAKKAQSISGLYKWLPLIQHLLDTQFVMLML